MIYLLFTFKKLTLLQTKLYHSTALYDFVSNFFVAAKNWYDFQTTPRRLMISSGIFIYEQLFVIAGFGSPNWFSSLRSSDQSENIMHWPLYTQFNVHVSEMWHARLLSIGSLHSCHCSWLPVLCELLFVIDSVWLFHCTTFFERTFKKSR